jgi:hypothetical protein
MPVLVVGSAAGANLCRNQGGMASLLRVCSVTRQCIWCAKSTRYTHTFVLSADWRINRGRHEASTVAKAADTQARSSPSAHVSDVRMPYKLPSGKQKNTCLVCSTLLHCCILWHLFEIAISFRDATAVLPLLEGACIT